MAKLNIRNRNKGKVDKDGRPKQPNWEYRFEIASVGGQRKHQSKAGFKTKKDAEIAGTKAMAEYSNTGRTFSPSEISVADYLDYWLENAIKKNIDHGYTYKTYENYEIKVRVHLKPAFGMYRLSAFQYSTDIIQQWVDEMKIKGLSKNMIKNTLSCLSGALNYAITPLKYIQYNPCLPVKIGKIPIKTKTKEHTEYVCSKDEFDHIMDRFPTSNNFHLALLAPYYIGTRIGETFAIDFLQDIDFDKHEIHINQQMVKIKNTWFFKPPKYESYRTIPIGKTLETTLKEIYRTRRKNQLFYGPYYMRTYVLPDYSIVQARSDQAMPYREIMPLCVKEDGTLLTPDSFKYCARVIHYELNNPLFHSHCLRHTHGTILAENGVNPKTVMERLGHKDIKVTLQTYTFNTDLMQQTAVDIFERATS